MMNPQNTPSWPAAQAANTMRVSVFKDPASTPEQKKAARDAFERAMTKCLREAGLIA